MDRLRQHLNHHHGNRPVGGHRTDQWAGGETYSAVVYIVESGRNNFSNMLRIPATLTVTRHTGYDTAVSAPAPQRHHATPWAVVLTPPAAAPVVVPASAGPGATSTNPGHPSGSRSAPSPLDRSR